MDKNQVFAALEKRGIAKAILIFSGGNDEGGVDNITLFDAQDKGLPELKTGGSRMWNNATHSYEPYEKGSDAELRESLEKPIDDKYGSFAGEFYASGELVWDVKNKTAKMQGSEEVSHDEPFEDEV